MIQIRFLYKDFIVIKYLIYSIITCKITSLQVVGQALPDKDININVLIITFIFLCRQENETKADCRQSAKGLGAVQDL